ncbi:MAG: pyruvate kinase [Burkholderiales bacterium]|nr:pyruvate kinase [Burkholderiales bacterium]
MRFSGLDLNAAADICRYSAHDDRDKSGPVAAYSEVEMPRPSWHRTKIICTLGPATDRPGVLKRLIGAGMDVARFNMSHGDHASHARRIRQVRQLAQQAGRFVAVLVDLPGPKFRLGELPGGARELHLGADVVLALEADSPDVLPVRHPALLQALRVGESVYLADGAIRLEVKTVGTERVVCQVLASGTVTSGSGINVPESRLSALMPTDDDRQHLGFALAQQAEWLGVSFVQSADDLIRIRALLPPARQPLLMAKIEKRQALVDLDAIVAMADGVMVARGDLGVETDLAEIPLVQKRIIALANAQARPVITATQMLESMVTREQPTRAEVTDVANAMLDGTDGVMLSAETAIGRFPVAAAAILQRVLTATETEYAARVARDLLRANESTSAANPISLVACQLAARLDAKAIIAPVGDMATVLGIARFRPAAPLVVVADSEDLCRRLAVVWGVSPLLAVAGFESQSCLRLASHWLCAQGLAQPGDPAVMLSTSGAAQGAADTLQVVRLEERQWQG